jgi:hypothetical protein
MFTDQQLFLYFKYVLALEFWIYSAGSDRKPEAVPIYLYGGIGGAIIFVWHISCFPASDADRYTSLSAANCSIAAVAVATTVVSPDYRIFPMISGGIPLWILTLIFLLLNFSGIANGDMATYLAYAGGAGVGFLFIYLLRKGRDGSIWINQFFDWFGDLFNPDKKKKPKNKKDEFYYNVSGTQPYKKIPNITQKRIDGNTR